MPHVGGVSQIESQMESNTQVLPMNEAYPFGIANGLSVEIAAIKEMPIEWNRKSNTSLRRGYVMELFKKHGLWERFKTEHWPNGNTHKGEVKCRWYEKLRREHEDLLAGRGDDEEGEAEEALVEEEEAQSFAREHDLRDFLAKNLNRIEPGLSLYSDGGRSGVEFVIDDGRIDLLAVDREGRLVVIELKVSRGRNKTIGQLLFYMGWVDGNLSKGKKCRGMIIAREITDDLVLAVQRVPGVSLCRYILSVSIESVATIQQ